MPTCIARSSTAIVHHVPAPAEEQFRQWQLDITTVAEQFAGYEGTDLYPPGKPESDQWVTVIHFTTEQALNTWLESPVRSEWIKKIQTAIGDFQLQRTQGGFSLWFAGQSNRDGQQLPPAWKMALTVWLSLYPTVMLLTIFVGQYTAPVGLSFSMLIGNALSVALLQWLVVPVLSRGLRPWLEANAPARRILSIGGACAIVAFLLLLAVCFRTDTG
ncbi:MAG: hypothetical protein SGJ20_04600 [Planctomycetota bacterium]|nr:hypothetical protein [Planctomycetota bacterium]